MNNELIHGDNAQGIFNGLHNKTINNNNESYMSAISVKKKYIHNYVNILSKAYYANLHNKHSNNKKYSSKSSLTINTITR